MLYRPYSPICPPLDYFSRGKSPLFQVLYFKLGLGMFPSPHNKAGHLVLPGRRPVVCFTVHIVQFVHYWIIFQGAKASCSRFLSQARIGDVPQSAPSTWSTIHSSTFFSSTEPFFVNKIHFQDNLT